MSRNFTVATKINKPVDQVFQAVVSREHLDRYFSEKSSGDLVEGQIIVWHWQEWGEYPVRVDKLIANERIELILDSKEWLKTKEEAYDVRVIMEFEVLDDGATKVSISESGWKTDADGLKGSHDNCGGWMHMVLCLKAYQEHGIDLR